MPERTRRPSHLGELLRRHRDAASLTQEELGQKARVGTHTIADIENGRSPKPHARTVSRLVTALELTGADLEEFKAAARGAAGPPGQPPATAGPPGDGDPRAWLAFIVAALENRGVAAARSAALLWQQRESPDEAYLEWVRRLAELAEQGRLRPVTQRPLPTGDHGLFLGRHEQAASLTGFLERVRQGRGGLALVFGSSGIGKSRLISQVLSGVDDSHAEWVTLGRGEAGYQGWRRLLAPLWTNLRRTEILPVSVLPHARTLDDIVLPDGDTQVPDRYLQWEVADAIAALTARIARHKPLVIVMDDAHRGGINADRLLLDVAQRINACPVGIIAAVRPDELDPGSPLRDYHEQASDRVASDVVTSISLPPLDLDSIAALIEKRTCAAPPADVVTQVAARTGGRPQLIKSIEVRPADGGSDAGWVVGGLGAEGTRVLLDTINARPRKMRKVLYAAAVCSKGRCADLRRIAHVTGMPVTAVERALSAERQLGVILAPDPDGYRFQHDNWTDALLRSCPPDILRDLHAKCLALLRADPAADPRVLVRHALGAGPGSLCDADLATLATQAADLNQDDYAFSSAARMYEIAARHSTAADQVDLRIKQADALRLCGWWQEARDVLHDAASLAARLEMPASEAVALIHLERIIWTYGLEVREVARRLRHIVTVLPPGDAVLRAQVRAALAMRLSIAERDYENEQADVARTALEQLSSVTDPLTRADIMLGAHSGLQDDVPVGDLLKYDAQVLDLGLLAHSAYHIGEALISRVVDLIRAGRLGDLPTALRDHRDFATRSAAPVVKYAQALLEALLALAHGEFETAELRTGQAGEISRDWGASMAGETLMAQTGWLLYETGQVDGLAQFLAELPVRDHNSLNREVWRLAAALINAESGQEGMAIGILRDVCAATGDLKGLARGPSRIGILAAAAMVLGHPAVCEAMSEPERQRLGTSLAELLADHTDTFVLAGWPAVLLGSKLRFTGLACLAAGQAERAASLLAQAAQENRHFEILHVRTSFDLARALYRQPRGRREAITAMRKVQREADQRGMKKLAAQATVELDRWSSA